MTMHMVHAGLTTVNTGKTKKKLNAKQKRALAEHEQWLRKQGLHPDQRSKTTAKSHTVKYELKNTDSNLPLSNNVVEGGYKKTIWDSQWRKTYEDDPLMAEREEDALRRAEKYKGRLMPLYNKGPVQLCTDLSTLKEGNGRGRNL